MIIFITLLRNFIDICLVYLYLYNNLFNTDMILFKKKIIINVLFMKWLNKKRPLFDVRISIYNTQYTQLYNVFFTSKLLKTTLGNLYY